MKVYSIGREMDCDIVINDNTDVISRRHAILSVDNFGKMTITDQSQNGTYVNGIRLSSNVAVPVSRRDNISFAQISRLDWSLIPNPTKIYKYIAASILGILLLAFLIWGGLKLFNGGNSNKPSVENQVVIEKEELSKEEIEKREQARQDSIKKAVQDSLKQITINKTTPRVTPQKPRVETGKEKKKEQPKETEQTKPNRIR